MNLVDTIHYKKIIKNISFIFFVMAFFTDNTFAITGKDNWKIIRSNNELIIHQPTFAGIFGPEGLFNACTTDDDFRSIKPVRICTLYQEVTTKSEEGFNKDYICASYETKQVSISRTFIQNICIRYSPAALHSSGECTEYKSITAVYPTTFSFPVIEGSSQDYGEFLFSKTFALQSCD